MINAELACLDFFVFLLWLFQFGSIVKARSRHVAPDSQIPPAFLAFLSGKVERFLHRLMRAALCSFSSAAHLVGYYVKEMESIAERWVMLFTGKSDDQWQGITPSWSEVSWKIPLFRREEGKVHKIGSGWHDHWNFCAEKEENLLNIRAKILSQPGPLKKMSRMQKEKKNKTRTYHPTFYYLVTNIVNNENTPKQCKAIYLKILLIIIQSSPDFSDFFPLQTACWGTGSRPDATWKQRMHFECCGALKRLFSVAANIQFGSQWNQEVAKEKDQHLNPQVSPTQNQQGIPNNTISQDK